MQLNNKLAQQVFNFKLKRKLLLVMSLLTLWTPLSLVQAQMTIDKNESAMQSVGQSSESSQEGPTVRVRAIGDILSCMTLSMNGRELPMAIILIACLLQSNPI